MTCGTSPARDRTPAVTVWSPNPEPPWKSSTSFFNCFWIGLPDTIHSPWNFRRNLSKIQTIMLMSSYLKCLMSPHDTGVEIQTLYRALSGLRADWFQSFPPAILLLFQFSEPYSFLSLCPYTCCLLGTDFILLDNVYFLF